MLEPWYVRKPVASFDGQHKVSSQDHLTKISTGYINLCISDIPLATQFRTKLWKKEKMDNVFPTVCTPVKDMPRPMPLHSAMRFGASDCEHWCCIEVERKTELALRKTQNMRVSPPPHFREAKGAILR